MKTLTTSCLLAILAAYSLDAQTVARFGSRSLRTQAAAQKPGPHRQLLVAPDVDHVFPMIMSSANWTTTVHLTNLEDRPITVDCWFISPNNEELALPMQFTDVVETGVSGTYSDLPPYTTSVFKTVSTDPAVTSGWAYCAANPAADRFSGYVVLRNTAANGTIREFVTPLQPDSEPIFSVALTDLGRTELLLINSSLDEDTSLALWAYDDAGRPAGNSTLTLKASHLRSIQLNDTFKDLKIGTIRVVVVEGSKYVTGMALRDNTAGYTVFPALTPR